MKKLVGKTQQKRHENAANVDTIQSKEEERLQVRTGSKRKEEGETAYGNATVEETSGRANGTNARVRRQTYIASPRT